MPPGLWNNNLPMNQPTLRIGVDTGGTFTDLLLDDGSGRLLRHKLLSTPADPAQAVLAGIAQIVAQWRGDSQPPLLVLHGSTVATNALLEGKVARLALVTTAGFENLLWIGRQNRQQLYDLEPVKAAPPLAREYVCGVAERMLCDGSVRTPLTTEAISELRRALAELQPEAVAICLLHSYANPTHERQLADAVRSALPQAHLTVSCELLPEFREYERTSTCVANAAVGPVMSRYLGRLEDGLGAGNLRVMSSAGGSLPPCAVRREPVRTILSGPAGGVLGAFAVAQAAGHARCITFDMGGTSTDVSLCDGGMTRSAEGEIAGLPVRLPMIDIHTVGAGGGSLAWLDEGGALRVGPQSLGAEPGPACYGRQSGKLQPTVTDAHVVLGHLPAAYPLSGSLILDAAAARHAVSGLAAAAGLSVEQAALGVLRVAEVTMARAVQHVSLERGHDPRQFTLLPFGGAGALHAARLAELLGIRRVLVPRDAGLLSALGMLLSGALYTYSQALMLRLPPHLLADGLSALAEVAAARARLHAQADAALDADDVAPAQRFYAESVDLRYVGQSYEINVALGAADALQQFAARHQALYGYCTAERGIEAVALRLEAGTQPRQQLMEHLAAQPASSGAVAATSVPVYDGESWITCQHIERDKLLAGDRLSGPCIISEFSATTLLPAGWQLHVNQYGQLLMQREPAGGQEA